MKIISFYKRVVGAFACAICFMQMAAYASDTALQSSLDDKEELLAAMNELEQALALVKNIEENKASLGNESVTNNEVSPSVAQYKNNEETDQDKLIADMAERMNDSYGLSNQDNSVIIGGIALNHKDKLVLKNFVEGIRDQLAKITGLKFPSSAYRIMIYGVVPKTDYVFENKSKYKINIVPDAMPHHDVATIKITILHPAAMDSHEFAENVIRGYLALYTYVMRNDNYAGESTELPKWFIKGLAKQIDFSSRQKDINNVLYMWSNGYIPSIDKLITENANLPMSNTAIASAIVAFWLDCGKPKERMATLFKKLANGEKWSPELYIETTRSNVSFQELNRGFDYWLLEQRFKVFQVGASSENLANRIITHLMFIPGSGIVPETAGPKWVAQPPAELSKFKNEPWAKKLAERKKRFLVVASTGRNDEFRAAASDLIAFYQAIIDGKASEEELRKKCYEAEDKLYAAITKEGE